MSSSTSILYLIPIVVCEFNPEFQKRLRMSLVIIQKRVISLHNSEFNVNKRIICPMTYDFEYTGSFASSDVYCGHFGCLDRGYMKHDICIR